MILSFKILYLIAYVSKGTGNIIWANKKEMDTLGYTPEEYIGHSIMEFCPDENERVLETFRLLGNSSETELIYLLFHRVYIP